ncbi:hypothetical protein RIF29_08100 [Crotalaria pallida]|uniref:Uncharacterized protein n=1 Tax=Crotalaria pallida TaxID=3830 RepID=A0AAN9PCD9_CROPI
MKHWGVHTHEKVVLCKLVRDLGEGRRGRCAVLLSNSIRPSQTLALCLLCKAKRKKGGFQFQFQSRECRAATCSYITQPPLFTS